MQDINKEEIDKEEKKEVRYLGSFLSILHLFIFGFMFWFGFNINDSFIWLIIVIYGFIFALSIMVYKMGEGSLAVFITVGSLFLGIFLLFSSCFMH